MLDEATNDEIGQTEDKPTEDEEEPDMNNDELTAYYNRYIYALVQDQKQQTNTFTEGQLKEFVTELFRSVHYELGEPDGNQYIRSIDDLSFLSILDQLVSTSCQICCEEDRPLLAMKVNLFYCARKLTRENEEFDLCKRRNCFVCLTE